MNRAVAFAPATVANVAVGFDILGFALEAPGDRVTVERSEDDGVVVQEVTGLAEVPADPQQNTAAVALAAMRHELGLEHGFRIAIDKGIPLSSGLGGSAASAVGAVVAAQALLPQPATPQQLLAWALRGEAAASGAEHADNVAPCLFGGLCAVLGDPIEVVPLPIPDSVSCALVRPHIEVETRAARASLRQDIALQSHTEQSARLAGFVTACFRGEISLLQRCMRDDIIEPQRKKQIPGFDDVQAAALDAGALACSIAGSVPTLFAWTKSEAETVRTAMVEAFAAHGLECDAWHGPIAAEGARVET